MLSTAHCVLESFFEYWRVSVHQMWVSFSCREPFAEYIQTKKACQPWIVIVVVVFLLHKTSFL